jgi:ABC-type Fe3+-citrate transport system substrate-binding protein
VTAAQHLPEPDATDHCLFAALPVIVGDWRATGARSEPQVETIAALDYRAALVAQDGRC